MIAKGNTHSSGIRLARYMNRAKDGERVEKGEVRGFASENIVDAFRSVDAMAEGTRGDKPMFHVQVRNRDGEHLKPEQWERVADRIESKLGMSSQPRAIVFHVNEQTGDRHMHIGWSRVEDETMTLRAMPFFKTRLKEVCRELEQEFGITPVRSERGGPVMAPTRDEDQQARRLGVDLRAVRAQIRECWENSDDGQSFQAALLEEGLTLLKGDRRAYLVMDRKGGAHALGQRILGVSATEVKLGLADLSYAALPNLEQAREELRTGMRDQHAANVAWEDAVAAAAIEKEKVVERFVEPTPVVSMDDYDRLAPLILDRVAKQKATFGRYDIEQALKNEIEDKATRAAMAKAILERADVIRLEGGKGTGIRYTLPEILESEQHVITATAALRSHDWHDVPGTLIDLKRQGLSDEKLRALTHVTGRDGLAIIDGQAGTGKSSVLAVAREVYEAAGCRVIGLSHTHLVVQDLKAKGFTEARTIASELYALGDGRTQWSGRTVVMVDEAAMVDTRRLAMILSHAQASGAKVILAGDDRQLPSIERGGMFEVLKRDYGAAVLCEVQRQNTPDQQLASQKMAQGDFRGALGIYAGNGAVTWTEKQSEAAAALVQQYSYDSGENSGKTRFVFAYTNEQVGELNAAIREVRNQRGELGESQSFETKHGSAEFAVGDRLQFVGTDKLRGVYNGQAGTVKRIDGGRFTVDLDGRAKNRVEFDAAAFKDFRHGYAGTIYKGQGRTIDQTYLLHSKHWRSASSYVALTRHSEKTELFVARETARDLPTLSRQISRRDEKRAASCFVTSGHGDTKPLSPKELAAWYANQDNYSRSLRPDRGEIRVPQTPATLNPKAIVSAKGEGRTVPARNAPSLAGAFGILGRLLGGGAGRPRRSLGEDPEERKRIDRERQTRTRESEEHANEQQQSERRRRDYYQR